jgi:AcrR family transcriptional regulator
MPRRAGPSLSRDDVIAAAVGCVERDGAQSLGVNAVARALGIQPPSLYNHVGGNDDLRRAVALEGWRRLADALPGGGDFHATAHAYRAFARAQPRLYELMSTEPLEGDRAARDALLARFRALVDEDVHALRVVRAALHGFVLLEATGQFGLREPVEASFERLVDALAPLVKRSSVSPAGPARRR